MPWDGMRYDPEVSRRLSVTANNGTTDYSTGSPAYWPEEVRAAHPEEFQLRWRVIYGDTPILPYGQAPPSTGHYPANPGSSEWLAGQGPYGEANAAANAQSAAWYATHYPELTATPPGSTPTTPGTTPTTPTTTGTTPPAAGWTPGVTTPPSSGWTPPGTNHSTPGAGPSTPITNNGLPASTPGPTPGSRTTNTGNTPGGRGYGPGAFGPGVSRPNSFAAGMANLPFQYRSGDNPADILANDRGYAYQQGSSMIDNYSELGNQSNQRARTLGDLGDNYFASLLEHPGYDAGDESAILNSDRLNAMNFTDAQAQSNMLTGGEQGDITGDPYHGQRTFERDAAGVERAAGADGGTLNDIYDEGATALNSANAYQSQRMDDSIDPGRLGLSQDYQDNYNFTPADQEEMVNAAGRSVGIGAQAQRDDLHRRAAAEGNTSALGLAAADNRANQTGLVGSADAMTNARLQARQLGLNTTQAREQQRLGTEQDISGRRMQAATTVGNQHQANQQFLTQGRAGAGLQTGQTLVNALANNAATTAGFAASGEASASQRAQALAQNRQQVNQANQAAQFDRGRYTDQAASQRATQVADTARADQTTGRADIRAGENQAYNQQNSNQAASLQAFSGVTGAGAASQQNAIRASQIPSTTDRLIAAGAAGAAGALQNLAGGGVVTKPTMARIGEQGPEMVVPLDSQANTRRYASDLDYPRYPRKGPQGIDWLGEMGGVGGAQKEGSTPIPDVPKGTAPPQQPPQQPPVTVTPPDEPPVVPPVEEEIGPNLPNAPTDRPGPGSSWDLPIRPPTISTWWGGGRPAPEKTMPTPEIPPVAPTDPPEEDKTASVTSDVIWNDPKPPETPPAAPPIRPPNMSTWWGGRTAPERTLPEAPPEPTPPATPIVPPTMSTWFGGEEEPPKPTPGNTTIEAPPFTSGFSNTPPPWTPPPYTITTGYGGTEKNPDGRPDGNWWNPETWGEVDDDTEMMANGGVVTRPTMARIGERGPEMVVPLKPMQYRRKGEMQYA